MLGLSQEGFCLLETNFSHVFFLSGVYIRNWSISTFIINVFSFMEWNSAGSIFELLEVFHRRPEQMERR